MSTHKKRGNVPFSSVTKKLRRMIQEGKVQKLWENTTDCARKSGIDSSLLIAQKNGKRSNQSVQESIRIIGEKFSSIPSKVREGPDNDRTLGSLYKEGEQLQLWSNKTEAAKICRIYRGTLNVYFDTDPKEYPVKSEKLLQRARLKLFTLIRRAKRDKKGSGEPRSQSVKKTLSDAAPRHQEAERHEPLGIIPSPWFDRILAGVAEAEDQNLDGMRFVLTSDSFRRFKGKFTKEEMDDTKLLIEELRRRLNILAQILDGDSKRAAQQILAHEVDELYLSVELARHVILTGAAIKIDRDRKALNNLRDST